MSHWRQQLGAEEESRKCIFAQQERAGSLHRAAKRMKAMNACSFVLILLGIFSAFLHVSYQELSVPVFLKAEMHRRAYFIHHPLSVLSAVPSKIISTASESTSLDCTFNCLKTALCLSFNFGIHSKLCQLLSTDKYDSSAAEKFGQSQEFDHYSIATTCMHQPCQEPQSRCRSVYSSDDDPCALPAIKYFPAAFGQSCDDRCKSLNLQCVMSGTFPNNSAVEIMQQQFGMTCKTITSYVYTDQPCYAPELGICYGAKDIPKNIVCKSGQNNAVKRLCPCVAYV